MRRFIGEPGYRHGSAERSGVLLVNLGTPAAPTVAAVRRYLRQFLSDPRVIETPRLPWWLVLNGIVLNLRPPRTAPAYASIWQDEGSPEGSPLLRYSRRQQQALARHLHAAYGDGLIVALGMSYGQPSLAVALEELRAAQVRRLLVLPLYPQYSGSTTGAVFDAVTRILRRRRWVPELGFINAYHDEPLYIEALAHTVRRHWQAQAPAERLLFSFHGLPRSYLDAGDPYHCQCHKTARLTAAALGLDDERWLVTFQSRFGRAEWLRPYTDETLRRLAGGGLASVDVLCPGFAADCLETLEEMNMKNRALFTANGGGEYRYIPCLNDDAAHVALLAALVEARIAPWVERAARSGPGDAGTEAAKRMGAPF